jgi:hypothetical protein
LATDLAGVVFQNPTTEFQPIFRQGKVEQYIKWISNLQNIMANHTVMENYDCALKTLKGSDMALWLVQCYANGPALADQNNRKAQKRSLGRRFGRSNIGTCAKGRLCRKLSETIHATIYYIGKIGVRAFYERLYIGRFIVLTEQELQLVLVHDTLRYHYIRKLKESKQQRLTLPYNRIAKMMIKATRLNIKSPSVSPRRIITGAETTTPIKYIYTERIPIPCVLFLWN